MIDRMQMAHMDQERRHLHCRRLHTGDSGEDTTNANPNDPAVGLDGGVSRAAIREPEPHVPVVRAAEWG